MVKYRGRDWLISPLSFMEQFALIGALVLALVEVAKKAGLKSRYAPALAVIIGLVLAGFISGWTVSSLINIGLVSALSAMGLYAGGRKTIEG